MAMLDRDVDRLVSEVLIELPPGASVDGIKATLYDVIDEFCDLSDAWYEYITLPIGAGTLAYGIYPRQGGRINRMIMAWDQNIVPISAQLSFGIPPGPSAPGIMQNVTVPPNGAIFSLVYPQSQNFTATILVAKSVILPTVQGGLPDAPDWFMPKFGRWIKEGLIGNLANQPGKPYTDKTLALYKLQRFQGGAAAAHAEAARAYLLGGQSWTFPRQFRTSSQRGGVSTAFPWIGR